MADYRIEERREDGFAVYVLQDVEAGVEAHVAPELGHNCFRWRQTPGGVAGPTELLAPPPNLGALKADPIRFGNPVLAPFPNRVNAGRFRFDGRDVALPAPFGGHAIHGLVLGKPWKVLRAAADLASAGITARIDSADHPEIGAIWPFPFAVQLTYRLREGLLWQEAEVFNTGDGELPMGYGIHPWFNLPLRSGSRSDAVVGVPAAARWELEACIPTGRVLAVDGHFDLRQPRPIAGLALDDVYTQLEYQKGWGIATLADPSGLRLEVGFDKAFRELVVYAPPQRDVICFEPYTCTTNALNLQPAGVDAGLIALQPNQSWRGMIYFAAESE